MAMTEDDIRLAAERLHQAERTRLQIRQISLDHPEITIADAYAIQKAWVAIKVGEGRVVKGHKIGLTSKAMQILDTRIERVDRETKSTRKIFDTIADNAANAGIVLGGRPLRPLDADLRWIGALCYRNGQLEETGLAAGVLNHPATSVAWLANKIAPLGLALEPGQVVLAGSFIRPIETRKGDTIQADYGPYGTVSCYFA